jgi:hypothetical protein
MQPRNQVVRKSKGNQRASSDRAPDRSDLDRHPRALLSVRSALVLTVAVLAALGGAGLFYAASTPLTVQLH